jgi:hypothetical protein
MSTPMPTPIPSGIDSLQIGISVLSIVLVAIQGYLVFRIDRARLKLEKFTGLTEKFALEVKPIVLGTQELLNIENKGTIPVKELLIKINLSIERTNEANITKAIKWRRKHQLNPTEAATVPLHDKLKVIFEEIKLIQTVEGMTVPYDNPETGDELDYTYHPAWLEKSFTVMLDMQIEANIEDEVKKIVRKYRLEYTGSDTFQEGVDDNYKIAASDYMGEWIE